MRKGPSIKSIKNFPNYFLCLLISLIVLDLIVCVGLIGNTKRINVSTAYLKVKTYKNVDLGENHFTTGSDGELYWHIKDLKEAILINVADMNGVVNLPDILYFLIINIFLFWFASGIKEDNIFSKVESSLRILTPLIFIYPILIIISAQISARCIRHLTGNQFTIQYDNFSILKYIVFGFLLQFLILFIKKGKNLQQENDLTI